MPVTVLLRLWCVLVVNSVGITIFLIFNVCCADALRTTPPHTFQLRLIRYSLSRQLNKTTPRNAERRSPAAASEGVERNAPELCVKIERSRCRADPPGKDLGGGEVGSSGRDDAGEKESMGKGKHGGGSTAGDYGTSSPISVADFSSAEGSERGQKFGTSLAARDGDKRNRGNRTKGSPLKRRKASSRGGGSGAEEGAVNAGNLGTSAHALFRGNVTGLTSFG